MKNGNTTTIASSNLALPIDVKLLYKIWNETMNHCNDVFVQCRKICSIIKARLVATYASECTRRMRVSVRDVCAWVYATYARKCMRRMRVSVRDVFAWVYATYARECTRRMRVSVGDVCAWVYVTYARKCTRRMRVSMRVSMRDVCAYESVASTA